jgi:SAM-dependent methyltransferase
MSAVTGLLVIHDNGRGRGTGHDDGMPSTAPFSADFRRSVRLIRAFRSAGTDEAGFYRLLAEDTIAQLGQYTSLAGRTVLDVGGGPGHFSRALSDAGARTYCLDLDRAELTAHGPAFAGSVQGSALALPFRDGVVDVCFSSNVLEHVPRPWEMAAEMVRVTRPGGLVFLAFTNWLSPWGGHETSPWHYLGGDRAARRYERRAGRPPKNRFGESLFPVSVREALAWARTAPGAELVEAAPRYLPSYARTLVHLPGVREIGIWNLLLVLRRSA